MMRKYIVRYGRSLDFRIQSILIIAFCTTTLCLLNSCKKILEVEPAGSTLLTTSVFTDSVTVQSSLVGMYTVFAPQASPYRASISTLPGFSADELQFIGNTYDTFINNSILPNNSGVSTIWDVSYSTIYNANSIIEGITGSKNISPAFQNQAVAEARFIRSFCYFYLVNFFGNVPLVLGTDINRNITLPKSPTADIYNQIIDDLKFAQANLPANYSLTGNARTRANKWAATALLARVYLYRQNWSDAETQASQVIGNTSLFSLPNNLASIFTPTSTEAILQLYNDNSGYTYYASQVLPSTTTNTPSHILNPSLINAFEAGDARKTAWTNTISYAGKNYSYPYKYKSLTSGANAEYFTLLRLAEQYLIRAEARAQQNNLTGAQADVNSIRARARTAAGTMPEITVTNQAAMLSAIVQENRIEFNCEMGHRWFDLKRTNTVDAVIGALKPTVWKSSAAFYPIPASQVVLNPNLPQNPGYIQ